jgi:peptidoglycan/xylan/chitin deacetylase (PgdA/CDA1 family)
VDTVWPEGKKMALSICFDDGWESQLTLAAPLLVKYGFKSSFYLTSESLQKEFSAEQLQKLKELSRQGHEIGNHTAMHPGSANFPWARRSPMKPLEDMSLQGIEEEINQAQNDLTDFFGQAPTTFSYPCGMTWVGRGAKTQSYVPLIAKKFTVGRGYSYSHSISPLHCDLAHVPATGIDNKAIEELITQVYEARMQGHWLILVVHHLSQGMQDYATSIEVFEKLLKYLDYYRNETWVETVATVGHHVQTLQQQNQSTELTFSR